MRQDTTRKETLDWKENKLPWRPRHRTETQRVKKFINELIDHDMDDHRSEAPSGFTFRSNYITLATTAIASLITPSHPSNSLVCLYSLSIIYISSQFQFMGFFPSTIASDFRCGLGTHDRHWPQGRPIDSHGTHTVANSDPNSSRIQAALAT